MKSFERVWALIKRIPSGKVATYGQLAEAASKLQKCRKVGGVDLASRS